MLAGSFAFKQQHLTRYYIQSAISQSIPVTARTYVCPSSPSSRIYLDVGSRVVPSSEEKSKVSFKLTFTVKGQVHKEQIEVARS